MLSTKILDAAKKRRSKFIMDYVKHIETPLEIPYEVTLKLDSRKKLTMVLLKLCIGMEKYMCSHQYAGNVGDFKLAEQMLRSKHEWEEVNVVNKTPLINHQTLPYLYKIRFLAKTNPIEIIKEVILALKI